MSTTRILVVPGHLPASPGATAADGTREHTWQRVLARGVVDLLGARGDYRERQHVSYSAHVADMTTYCRAHRDIAYYVELHTNAATPQAHGCEVLHWWGSTRGEAAARQVSARIAAGCGLRDRGPKAKRAQDRGGAVLGAVRPVALIIETHFGSNPVEHARMTRMRDSGELAAIIDDALASLP